jgi:hypothetical protein
MSAYSDCYAAVVALTNRSALQTLTDMQIRAAIRKAHRAGSFPRDVQIVTVSGLSTANAIQTVDLSAYCPRLRQLKAVKPTSLQDIWYHDEDIGSILDPDGFAKLDVYWQVGTTLNVRPASVTDSLDIYWLGMPDLTDLANFSDWILVNHSDLIAHWAAAAVLGAVGETEAKAGVEELAKALYEDLIEESVEIIGR